MCSVGDSGRFLGKQSIQYKVPVEVSQDVITSDNECVWVILSATFPLVLWCGTHQISKKAV